MRINMQLVKAISYVLFPLICLTGCQKELKKGNVVIENYKYVVKQVSKHLFEVGAEGTVKNVGNCDVKSVVVTSFCRSCQKKMIEGQWFDSDVPKTPDQEAIISYLSPGAEASFRFESIADMLTSVEPSELPEKMDIRIVSFDTVQ